MSDRLVAVQQHATAQFNVCGYVALLAAEFQILNHIVFAIAVAMMSLKIAVRATGNTLASVSVPNQFAQYGHVRGWFRREILAAALSVVKVQSALAGFMSPLLNWLTASVAGDLNLRDRHIEGPAVFSGALPSTEFPAPKFVFSFRNFFSAGLAHERGQDSPRRWGFQTPVFAKSSHCVPPWKVVMCE